MYNKLYELHLSVQLLQAGTEEQLDHCPQELPLN